MSDDGKLVFLFLLTHPHMTSLGAMRGTFPGLAAELGWSARRFESAALECLSQHIVESNEEAAWIGIPNFLRYNEPEGPNSVSKAWAKALDMLPECPEKHSLMERCRSYLAAQSDAFKHAMGDAIWDAFGDVKSGPCHIQEQEQEQEQKSPLPPKGVATGLKGLQPEEILRKWNTLPGVKPCKKLGKTIRDRIQTRLKDYPSQEWWTELMQQVGASDFLCGRTKGKDGPFQASLDWVLGTTNLDKILAGNYDNRAPTLKEKGTCQWSVANSDGRTHRPCGKAVIAGQSRPFCDEHRKERDRLDTQLSKGAA